MQYVLIHGLGQTPSSWDKTLSLISKREDISRPDLRALVNDKEPDYANLYKAFSEHCNDTDGALNLCGVSLGAILALNYGLEHPEKVTSLALIGAQFKMPKTMLKLQNMIFLLMPEASFVKRGLVKKDIIALTNSMTDLDFSGRLQELSCPALIVCGDKDNANKKAARSLAEKIPNAELHIIANAGHEVNVDAPEQLAAILNAFWQ